MISGFEKIAALQRRRDSLITKISKIENEIERLKDEILIDNPFETEREYANYLAARAESFKKARGEN